MARIAAEDENLAQQTDFSITFSDRQNISKLEECTINVRMILSTMLDNMTHVRDQCKKYCSTCCNGNHEDGPHRDCSYFVEEFDRYAKETKMYVERTEYLFQRVRSTARLVSMGRMKQWDKLLLITLFSYPICLIMMRLKLWEIWRLHPAERESSWQF